tara:strand:- start:7948 stop:9873 length:1926 start_codon:yes stop_codon:yes gene_type:complete
MSLYSAVMYMIRLNQNRQARKALTDNSAPLRTLTASERQCINNLSGLEGHVTSSDVYSLQGSYSSHGITTNGNTVMHDAINDVLVYFPYDAESFLRAHNEAEVVFTSKGKGVVIAMNGEFDIATAEQRVKDMERRQQRWEEGVTGDLDQDDVIQPDDEDSEIAELTRVHTISSREETEKEKQQRQTPGLKWLSVIFLLGSFISLQLLPEYPQVTVPLAGVLFLLFLVTYFYRGKAKGSVRVNKVQGVMWQDRDGFYIGGMRIQVPPQWISGIEMDGRPQTYEVNTEYHLMSANGFSMERTPPVKIHYAHHVTLAITAIILLCSFFMVSSHIKADFYGTLLWLNQEEPHVYNNMQDVERTPLHNGDYVRLQGPGRCWFNSMEEYTCTRRLFGAPAELVDISELQLPEDVRRLNEDSWFQEVELTATQMLYIQMLEMRGEYVDVSSMRELQHPAEFLRLIKQACEARNNCDSITYDIMRVFDRESWEELFSITESEGYEDNPVTLNYAEYSTLQDSISLLVQGDATALIRRIKQRLLEHSDKGIVVWTDPPMVEEPLDFYSNNRIAELRQLAGPESLREVETEGFVVYSGRRGVTIDTSRAYDDLFYFLSSTLSLLLVLGVFIWQAALWVVKYQQEKHLLSPK